MTGTAALGTTIDCLDVDWRVRTELDPAYRSRLDRLIRGLADGPLEAMLDDDRRSDAGEVCLRQIAVPPHRMSWERSDADLVAGWSEAIRMAIATGSAPEGNVVRYADLADARLDLATCLLFGQRSREWAWRLLDLWPADEPEPAAIAAAVGLAVTERPASLVTLAVELARHGKLGALVEILGLDAFADLVARTWYAAGGVAWHEPTSVRGGGFPPLLASDLRNAGGRTVGGVSTPLLAGDIATAVRSRSRLLAGPHAQFRDHHLGLSPPAERAGGARPTSDGASAGRAAFAQLPLLLAALALLEVEPAYAAAPIGTAIVRLLAHDLREGGRSAASSQPDSHTSLPASTDTATPDPGAAVQALPIKEQTGNAEDHTGSPRVVARTALGAATSWGGLVFLLPLLADLGIPERVVADPANYGDGLRPVLYELGRSLVSLAAPDAPVPDEHDPGLLAFCGLAPTEDLPEAVEERRDILLPEVVRALRSVIGAEDRDPDHAVVLKVCRRQAVITADPGWIDIHLRLDEVDVNVRRAGLDLDPGYLPWLGCVVRFCYA